MSLLAPTFIDRGCQPLAHTIRKVCLRGPATPATDRHASTRRHLVELLKRGARNWARHATKGAGSCNASFDPIRSLSADGVGRHRNGRRGNAPNPAFVERVEIPHVGGSKGSNACPAGGLMRCWKQHRGARGNLAHSAPSGASSMGLWTAQACNCGRRGRIWVSGSKPAADQRSASQAMMNRTIST